MLLIGACAKTDSPIEPLAQIAANPASTTQPRISLPETPPSVAAKRQDRLAARNADKRIAAASPRAVPASLRNPEQNQPGSAFRPTLIHILRPEPFSDPGRFVALNRQKPAPQVAPQAVPQVAAGSLAHFYEKLAALENGTRSQPVTILHIGDSHVAADSFTRGIRSRLQQRFGDSGRGMVIPAGVFKQTAADQVTLSQRGSWQAASSLKDKSGPYGVSGVRLASSSPGASISLTLKSGTFDWAEVTVAGGSGSFTIDIDGAVSRHSAEKGAAATTVKVVQTGKTLRVSPTGDGKVTVLNWATGNERPGIRYVNFGIVGATVDVTRRWDPAIVANDLAELKLDLIVYGYGTNEGFNDNLDQKAYRDYTARFMKMLKSAAPDAGVVFIGAADGARRGRGKGCGGSWSTPAKLESVRTAVREVAATTGAGYWNWADIMGGRCAIDSWAAKGLAAKDRVHLTNAGYDRSADAFVDYLVAPLDKAVAMTR